MKLFNQYKDYVKNNDGIDVEFPEYKIDFEQDGDSNQKSGNNKSRNKGKS